MRRRWPMEWTMRLGPPPISWRFVDEVTAAATSGQTAGGSAGGGAVAGTAGGTAGGTSTPAAIVGHDGKLADNWLATMPQELRSDRTLASVKTVGDMAVMLVNGQKTIGKLSNNKNFAILPAGPDDKPGWDAWYKAAGRPDTADGYPVIEPPADMPKEMTTDAELTKSWRSWCHEAGLSAQQMASLSRHILDWNIASHKLAEAELVKQQEAANVELTNEWQGQKDAKVQLANTAVGAFADGPLLQRLKDKGFFADPDNLRLMAAVGEAVSPDRLHARSDGRPDVNSIRAKIAELENSEAYRNPEKPGHAAVTAQVLQLREQLITATSVRARIAELENSGASKG